MHYIRRQIYEFVQKIRMLLLFWWSLLIKIGKILEQVRPDVALKHHQIHAVTGCDN